MSQVESSQQQLCDLRTQTQQGLETSNTNLRRQDTPATPITKPSASTTTKASPQKPSTNPPTAKPAFTLPACKDIEEFSKLFQALTTEEKEAFNLSHFGQKECPYGPDDEDTFSDEDVQYEMSGAGFDQGYYFEID